MLLLCALAFTFETQYVNAGGMVYILSDGSIDPPTAPIQRNGNTYILTSNVYNTSIIIQKDNIVFNGHGCSLQNSEVSINFGVYLLSRRNVTIANLVVSGFAYGLLLESSSGNRLINNTVFFSSGYGIELYSSPRNVLEYNVVVSSDEAAISLIFSSGNILTGNDVRSSYKGISIRRATTNILRSNVMAFNRYNFDIDAIMLGEFVNDIDASNLVDGRPIYYWLNRSNETIPSDAGCVIIVNSTRMTVKDLRLSNNFYEVYLAYTTHSLVRNVSVEESWHGIIVDGSPYNLITQNTADGNAASGIQIRYTSNNNVTYNSVSNTSCCGIWLEDCTFCTVVGNTVNYTYPGAGGQECEGAGILVDDSALCSVVGNNVTRSTYGIAVGPSDSIQNVIAGNNLEGNGVGLLLAEAQYNIIYHNNFVRNEVQAQNFWMGWSQPTHNTLDLGIYGGNYWSNYNGSDSNHDGIGDTPYTINQANIDRYPLMHSWRLWDVNCDGLVNVLDLIKIANALGFKQGDACWNPNADVKEDGVVNVLDLIVVAKRLGT